MIRYFADFKNGNGLTLQIKKWSLKELHEAIDTMKGRGIVEGTVVYAGRSSWDEGDLATIPLRKFGGYRTIFSTFDSRGVNGIELGELTLEQQRAADAFFEATRMWAGTPRESQQKHIAPVVDRLVEALGDEHPLTASLAAGNDKLKAPVKGGVR